MQLHHAKRQGQTQGGDPEYAKKARKEGAAATAAYAVLHSSLLMLEMLMNLNDLK